MGLFMLLYTLAFDESSIIGGFLCNFIDSWFEAYFIEDPCIESGCSACWSSVCIFTERDVARVMWFWTVRPQVAASNEHNDHMHTYVRHTMTDWLVAKI